MIRTGRDDGRGLVAAYREEMGFAAIAIVGGPAGTRVFAVVPGDAEAKAAAEAAQARWWCRHAADAERIAAAAARRLGREAKAAAGGQADTSAAFSLAGAAVRAAAKRFAIALQADAEIAEEAMAVAARIDAELQRQRQSGELKSVNTAYRSYRLQASGGVERVLRYDEWMLKYKENLVRQVARTLRQI